MGIFSVVVCKIEGQVIYFLADSLREFYGPDSRACAEVEDPQWLLHVQRSREQIVLANYEEELVQNV
jgi:hypothetical protein